MKNSRLKIKNWLVMLGLLYFAFLIGCSIPSLEKPECTEARTAVKEFYSYHFGNDMKPSPENMQRLGKFLTEELKRSLAAPTDGKTDYFTQTDDYPKAFRVGKCEVSAPDKTDFQVVLFWKDETRNEQREVKVETVRQNNAWLINRVEKVEK